MIGTAPHDPVRVPTGLPSGNRRPSLSLAWWALACAFVTTAGLAVIAWVLLVLDALTYGVSQVFAVTVDPPFTDRYGGAFAVAVAVNLGGTLVLSRLALRTSAAGWPPALAGALVAIAAGAIAASVLLLMLGINPVTVVTHG